MGAKDRRQLEKEQEEALAKAAPKSEEAPKPKHIRSSIITTWEHRSGEIFWQALFKMPLGTNAAMTWKCVHIIHKLLHDGHPSVIPETYRQKGRLNQLAGLWNHQSSTYSSLITAYLRFINDKLDFHHTFQSLKGDLNSQIEQFQAPNYDASSAFSFVMSIMDLHDSVLHVGSTILGSLNLRHSQTQTECRVSALQPITQESRALYFIAYQLLQLLHGELDLKTLSDHDQKFVQQWYKLKKFYFDIGNLKYLKGLVDVPDIGDEPPRWLQEGPPPPQPIDKFASFGDVDESASFGPNKDYEAEIARLKQLINRLLQEIERLKAEIERLNRIIANLQAEREDHDASAGRARERFGELEKVIEEQKKRMAELAALEETAKAAQAEAQSSMNKFNQMSQLYQKLRGDHLTALKANAANKQEIDKLNKANADVLKAKEDAKALEAKMKLEFDHLKIENERLTQLNSEMMVANADQGAMAMKHADQISDLNKSHLDALNNLKMQSSDEAKKLKERLEAEMEKLKQAELAMEKQKREEEEAKESLNAIIRGTLDGVSKQSISVIQRAVEDFESGHLGNDGCSAAYTIVSAEKAKEAAALVAGYMVEFLSAPKEQLPAATIVKLPQFADAVADMLANSKGSLRLAADDAIADEISVANKKAASSAIALLKSFTGNAEFSSMGGKVEAAGKFADTCFSKVIKVTDGLIVKEVEDSDQLGNVLELQMKAASDAIRAAAQKLEEMLAKAKKEQEGLKLNVHESIIGGSSALMECIRVLIERAEIVQSEIVEQGRGSGNPAEFYRQNHTWAEGLISAAKAVGWGANVLVEGADEAVSGKGKFEAIVAAANEIMSSTAHLVAASRVKAQKNSKQQGTLEVASKEVRTATRELVKAAKNASQLMASDKKDDFSGLSENQLKRAEMQKQIRILELEKQLEQERKSIFAMRKDNYKHE